MQVRIAPLACVALGGGLPRIELVVEMRDIGDLDHAAFAAFRAGRLQEAAALCDEALDLLHEHRAELEATEDSWEGDWVDNIVCSLLNLRACIYLDAGDRAAALAVFEDLLPLVARVASRYDQADVIGNLGDIHAHEGRFAEAAAAYTEAVEVIRAEAAASLDTEDLAMIRGISPEKVTRERAETLATFEADYLLRRATVERRRGRFSDALADARRAVCLHRAAALPMKLVWSLAHLSLAADAAGEPRAAGEATAELLALLPASDHESAQLLVEHMARLDPARPAELGRYARQIVEFVDGAGLHGWLPAMLGRLGDLYDILDRHPVSATDTAQLTAGVYIAASDVSRALGDHANEGAALESAAEALQWLGPVARRRFWERAAKSYEAAGDTQAMTTPLLELGMDHSFSSDPIAFGYLARALIAAHTTGPATLHRVHGEVVAHLRQFVNGGDRDAYLRQGLPVLLAAVEGQLHDPEVTALQQLLDELSARSGGLAD